MTIEKVSKFMHDVRLTAYQTVRLSESLKGENVAVLNLVIELVLKTVQEQLIDDDKKRVWDSIEKEKS